MATQVADVLRDLAAALQSAGARWYLFGAPANAGRLDLAHVRDLLSELELALDRSDLIAELEKAVLETA
jgi:methionine synthase II (cobalamin-independent)